MKCVPPHDDQGAPAARTATRPHLPRKWQVPRPTGYARRGIYAEVSLDLDLYFTQYFGVDPDALETYGAFDISVVSDLPLFVDPFLLFNSEKPDLPAAPRRTSCRYLRFLRDHAAERTSTRT